MILARLTQAIRTQNWFAVALEFVIVIAGVVIGFQVTAWNAERGERELELRYLERLTESVAADADEFADAANLAAQRGGQARQILAALDDPSQASTHPDAFLLGIVTAAYTYTPNVDRIAYDEMINRGHIGLIRNEDVRSQIAAYYRRLEVRSQWDYMRAHVQTRYMTLRAGVLTPAQERLQSEPATAGRYSAEDVEIAMARIADRPEMIAWLPTVEFWQQYNEDTYTAATAQAHALQAILQAERERLE
ncbi:hypothetical protein HXX25_00465 [Hyphobacterium sp. CCMP332]|uniref:hypothetical protein n=1 Tax=Hyphobacterium sp. CCMP332 TaxID=2749086 RepID=UPI00165072BC|nr:hypothetical protein [Hyphobacterium sp. CCMP332]QNL17938.1 hypothetical protein HXX25_00465 [Hyphobacterium sp. CCMP332]